MKKGIFLRIGNFSEEFWQGEFDFAKELRGRNWIDHAEFGVEYPHLGPSTCTSEQIYRINENLGGLDIVIHPQLYYDNAPGKLRGKKFDLASSDNGIRKFSLQEMLRCYQLAKKVNARVITIHGGYCQKDNPADYRAHFSTLRQSLKELNDFGDIKIGLENLPIIDYFGNRSIPRYPEEVAELVEGLENVGTTFDIGHANTMMPPSDFYKKLIEYGVKIFDMHVHDNSGADDHLALGEGNIDFESFLRLLKRTDYSGYFNLELDIPWNKEPVPSQEQRRKSIDFLKERKY
jgi:sugar phosphate isomerase/epimerase